MSQVIASVPDSVAGGATPIVGINRVNQEPDVFQNNYQAAQSFTPISGTWNVTTVSVYINKTNTYTPPDAGNLILEIRETAPDGILVSSALIDRLTVSLSVTDVVFTFSACEVTSTKSYYLVLYCASGNIYWPTFGLQDSIQWFRQPTGVYGAKKYKYDGISWTNGAYPYCFSITANPSIMPSKPVNPDPANNSEGINFSNKTVSWENGGDTTSYAVWFGKSGGLQLVQANVTETSLEIPDEFIPVPDIVHPEGYKFYWRVDAVSGVGTTTGDEWNFDARPAKVINPTPENGLVVADFLSEELRWERGSGNTTSYDVYFGTFSTPVFAGNVTTVFKTIPYTMEVIGDDARAFIGDVEIEWDEPFYWRIDARNEFGVTLGDVWNFDARPAKTVNLVPINAAAHVNIRDANLHWDDGSYDAGSGTTPYVTEYYDVYTNFAFPEEPVDIFEYGLNGRNTYEVTIKVDYILEPETLYLWRVDARNRFGITEGDEQIFLTWHSNSFPWERPYGYDPYLVWGWDVDHYDWIDANLLAVGGGRYKQQLIIIGHRVIYFGE